MYRTIVKNLHHIKVLKNKWELRNQGKEALKHLKRSAPEDQKCSWRMITSSEADSHQKQVVQKQLHQKLKLIRSWLSPQAEDSKINTSKVIYWIRKHCRRLLDGCNGHFGEDLKALEAYLQKALTLYYVRTVQPPSPLLCFVSTLQDKKNSSACNDVPLQWEWIWNWSFIGQLPYQAKDHWWLIKASNDSILMCWQFHNVSFTHLYKGVKT